MYIHIYIYNYIYTHVYFSNFFVFFGGSIWYQPNVTCHKDLKKHQETLKTNMTRGSKQHWETCTGTFAPPTPPPKKTIPFQLFSLTLQGTSPYPTLGKAKHRLNSVLGKGLSYFQGGYTSPQTNISPEKCCLENKPFLLKWSLLIFRELPQNYHAFALFNPKWVPCHDPVSRRLYIYTSLSLSLSFFSRPCSQFGTSTARPWKHQELS